jgi:hypothetical protein
MGRSQIFFLFCGKKTLLSRERWVFPAWGLHAAQALRGVEKSVAKSAQALRGVAKSARQRAPRGRCKKIFFQSECFC